MRNSRRYGLWELQKNTPLEYLLLELIIIPAALLFLGAKMISQANAPLNEFNAFKATSDPVVATVTAIETTTMFDDGVNPNQIIDSNKKELKSAYYQTQKTLFRNSFEYNIDNENYKSVLYSWQNLYKEKQQVEVYCSKEDRTVLKVQPERGDEYDRGVGLVAFGIVMAVFIIAVFSFKVSNDSKTKYSKNILKAYDFDTKNNVNTFNAYRNNKNPMGVNGYCNNGNMNNQGPMGVNGYRNNGNMNNQGPMGVNGYRNNGNMNNQGPMGVNGYRNNGNMNNQGPMGVNGYRNNGNMNNQGPMGVNGYRNNGNMNNQGPMGVNAYHNNGNMNNNNPMGTNAYRNNGYMNNNHNANNPVFDSRYGRGEDFNKVVHEHLGDL